MSVQLLEAKDGAPLTAVCDECNEAWRRPEWDPRADTLIIWARGHDCTSTTGDNMTTVSVTAARDG